MFYVVRPSVLPGPDVAGVCSSLGAALSVLCWQPNPWVVLPAVVLCSVPCVLSQLLGFHLRVMAQPRSHAHP